MTLVGWQRQALARKADQFIARRLARDLLRAFDAGEPVHLGRLRVDRAGITDTAGSPPVFVAWRVIEHAAAGHPIQIRYTQDGLLPPRRTATA